MRLMIQLKLEKIDGWFICLDEMVDSDRWQIFDDWSDVDSDTCKYSDTQITDYLKLNKLYKLKECVLEFDVYLLYIGWS